MVRRYLPATTVQMVSSVAGLTQLKEVRIEPDRIRARTVAVTHWIFSCESTEGTNSLLMKSPVGTLSFLPVCATVISTGLAIVTLVMVDVEELPVDVVVAEKDEAEAILRRCDKGACGGSSITGPLVRCARQ